MWQGKEIGGSRCVESSLNMWLSTSAQRQGMISNGVGLVKLLARIRYGRFVCSFQSLHSITASASAAFVIPNSAAFISILCTRSWRRCCSREGVHNL
ncbi:hypothetical protein K450DRAFT_255484 [Umbelopsis ramanniana AG]|uniref:Uncharacterized protein n=1 Tax=Umbelopsis ramanniana AG TaxID=1314678 RepID=A0AAD5E3A6_UMBRA|nr:uncharacterized protein K450DRAFT_255484 [Umbelopsis ramanniana AG]KAI8576763.1 hypothetical protein K450DRAFT_255484 [Umbelopsis ramanniana AG]